MLFDIYFQLSVFESERLIKASLSNTFCQILFVDKYQLFSLFGTDLIQPCTVIGSCSDDVSSSESDGEQSGPAAGSGPASEPEPEPDPEQVEFCPRLTWDGTLGSTSQLGAWEKYTKVPHRRYLLYETNYCLDRDTYIAYYRVRKVGATPFL